MAQEDNTWEDNEFDNEFEDDDDEFNKSGGGWENSDPDDDPFDIEDPNDPNNGWGTDPGLDPAGDADEVENKYYEAYYEKDDMQLKLSSFLKVIELINDGGDDSDNFGFKSLTEIIILYFTQNSKENVIKYFKQFLIASNNVKPNDLSSNLRKILNTTKSNKQIYDELHDLTMKAFKPSNNSQSGSITHLWFELGIERCHDFIQHKIFQKCQGLINELHETLKSNENADKSQSMPYIRKIA